MDAKTEVMHDLQMGGMDNAWTGAMTGLTHEQWMDCAYDAHMGGTYDALTIGDFTGFHAGNLPWSSPHTYRGFSTGLQQTVMR